jgi:hypothetical protein
MSKQIRELRKELLAASGLDLDHRFRSWAKFIDKVDESKSNGYAFVGDFVGEGTVEVEVKPRLFLVMAESGSTKYHYAYYVVVKMNADGTLEPTDIATDGRTAGWALRIREQVAQALLALDGEQVSPLAPYSDGELLDELIRRGYPLEGYRQ